MLKVLVALVAGLVGAAIVHIAVVFAMPRMASNDSWGRLSRLGPPFDLVRIETERDPADMNAPIRRSSARYEFSFVDPAFLTASCRFSLDDGPVHLSSRGEAEFWSASVYTRRGDNVYSINDRTAVNGRFDLLVGSADQLVDTRAVSPAAGETMIPVTFAESDGYVTVRTLVDTESARASAEEFLRGVTCVSDDDDTAAPVANAGG